MDHATRIEALFHAVFSRFASIPARQKGTGDVTVAQIKALLVIEMAGTVSVRRLAETLGVSSAAACELADRLVRSGHLRRERSTEDRRLVQLTLRARGRQLLARFAEMRAEKAKKLLDAVGREDGRRLEAALETVNLILGKVPR